MRNRNVFIGPDWVEAVAEENVTPLMAAKAAMPFYCEPRTKKVPTSWVVPYLGRVRRIYADIVGNAGTSYVLVKGERHFVR